MIQWLVDIDHSLFDLLNGWGNSVTDQIMLFMSAKYPWIPLYVILIIALIIKFKRQFWFPLIYVLIVFALDDQLTSGFMKPFFERLRPCHDLTIVTIKQVAGCGGKYGFASSHAANTMGLAMCYFLLFGKQWWTILLFIWAFVVGYSRIYLGVHFPADVIVGMLIGVSTAYVIQRAMITLNAKMGSNLSLS